jgi:hypothetical protein
VGFEGAELAVVALDSERAKDAAVTGAKAANLARAAVAGLPVLPGFVLVSAERAPTTAVGENRAGAAGENPAGDDRDVGTGPAQLATVSVPRFLPRRCAAASTSSTPAR